jgi:hypothetical protein
MYNITKYTGKYSMNEQKKFLSLIKLIYADWCNS